MHRYLYLLIFAIVPIYVRAYQLHSHVADSQTHEALPYVTICVRPGVGTLTNAEGDFTLQDIQSSILQLSCIGYESKSVPSQNLPDTIYLKPLTATLRELTVLPVNTILERVAHKMTDEYHRRSKKTCQYFYRLTTSYPGKREFVEAFTEANSAVNLRDLKFLNSYRGQIDGATIRWSRITSMNLHHPIELGPMIMDSRYWRYLVTPLNAEKVADYQDRYYAVSCEVMTDEDGKEIYKINLAPKDSTFKDPIMTGSLYVNPENYHLLRFEGEVRNMTLEVKQDLRAEEVPAELDVHVNYSHDQGYTEVADMSSTVHAEGIEFRSMLYNIQDMKLKVKTKNKQDVPENVLATVEKAAFDSTLWAHGGIVQRTREEERLYDDIQEEQKVQTMQAADQGPFRPLMERLGAFGKIIPQEKVYVHMDNTCYFKGDTIWFSAYTRQTTDDKPSHVSGVLYVELLNNDGYLVERKLIEMKQGRGTGYFALDDEELYAGFYELRAYTRWQLNWGRHERPHSPYAYNWFVNQRAEDNYFLDYDKLYSRVFPVYDKPKTAGTYSHDMTMRAMRRYYRKDPKRKLLLNLYPEGGNLVAGVPCRVAFEATWDDGEWADGIVHLGNSTARTENRGRGVLTIIPEADKKYTATFVSKDSTTATASLPEADTDGVSLSVYRNAEEWIVRAQIAGNLSPDSLAVTIMREGVVEEFLQFPKSGRATFSVPRNGGYAAGVHQVTVFDTHGNVLADRLFFLTTPGFSDTSLLISTDKKEYEPCDPIHVDVKAAPLARKETGAPTGNLSISIRDAQSQDGLFDNGSILTEMLLSSEIRGFVPQPGWYFEKDDEEHNVGLDLLMMTQGWRRFNWRDMAVRGEWDLTQRDERTPILLGYVSKSFSRSYMHNYDEYRYFAENTGTKEDKTFNYTQAKEVETAKPNKVTEADNNRLRRPWEESTKPSKELLVHAQLMEPTGNTALHWNIQESETTTQQGIFRLQLPKFYEDNMLLIGAADPDEVKKLGANYPWVQIQNLSEKELTLDDEEELYGPHDPEYLVRIQWPYPRFVKPYNYYQNHLSQAGDTIGMSQELLAGDVHQLKEVSVKAGHSGLRKLDDSQPAYHMDAYEAYNNAMDAGMSNLYIGLNRNGQKAIVRSYLGDYGLSAPFSQDGESIHDRIVIRNGLGPTRRALSPHVDTPKDSLYSPKYLYSYKVEPLPDSPGTGDEGGMNILPGERREFDNLGKLDRYYIYTDYSLRLAGDERYKADLPETALCIYPYPDDSRRPLYKNRRILIHGFAEPAEFYSPNYSQFSLPEGQKDYRRTLYWNPDLKLDENGEAHITLYNNSRTTHLSVEAEGQTTDGTLLWGRE